MLSTATGGEMLYHGTAAKHLDEIEKNGLIPRAQSKIKSNWTHTVTSNKDAVYLTDAYAWHFAVCASKDDKGLILEIDRGMLRPELLCPDEDVLEQTTRGAGPSDEAPNFAPIEWSMARRTRFYRKLARHNPNLVDASLSQMGTCGYYGAIPWEAVTRYVIVDLKKLPTVLRYQAIDSQVSILNYRVLKDRHRAFTHWFFGDQVTASELTGNNRLETTLDTELKLMLDEQDKRMAEAMNMRNGLQVVDVNHEKEVKYA
jgi:hypothetical protein